MKVREILAEVAQIAEGSQLKQSILEEIDKSDPQIKEKTDLLLSCYNAVLKDVAINYDEVISTEYVPTNQVDLTKSEDTFIKLISVSDAYDNAIDYTLIGNVLKVKNDGFKYTYRSIPNNQEVDDLAFCTSRIIGEFVYIYGTLAEYFLRENRLEEAQNWESRFRQSVEIRRDYTSRRLKAGRKWGL